MMAVAGLDPVDPAWSPRMRVTPGAERKLRPPAPMRLGIEAGDRRRHDPAHRVLRQLDDVHRSPGGDRDRGEFEPDKAGPNHDHLARLGQTLAQDVGVGEGPQRQNPIEFGAGHRQRPVARAGGQYQMVEPNLVARS